MEGPPPSLDFLKQGIGLVVYGQKDPLIEYKKQVDIFQEMPDRGDTSTIRSLFNLRVISEEPPEAPSTTFHAARHR